MVASFCDSDDPIEGFKNTPPLCDQNIQKEKKDAFFEEEICVSSSSFFCATATKEHANIRLDKASSLLFPSFSRTQIEKFIELGQVQVNNAIQTKRQLKISEGDYICFNQLPFAMEHNFAKEQIIPVSIPFHILYEDEDLFVINKPSGLVVHPAPGNWNNTFVHGFLAHYPLLCHKGLDPRRPGIIHRLDKDTSGVLIAAKNQYALWKVAKQFEERRVYKEYRAIVQGQVSFSSKTIRSQIGRNEHNRKKMAVVHAGGRDAITECLAIDRSQKKASYMKIILHTGRTHQIRVHLAHIGHAIIADEVYGKPFQIKNESYHNGATHFLRQMLHCYSMQIQHPVTNSLLTFIAPLPQDMIDCLQHFTLSYIDDQTSKK